jgi:hypothetical protein
VDEKLRLASGTVRLGALTNGMNFLGRDRRLPRHPASAVESASGRLPGEQS